MGITILKFYIWGGILSDIRSEILVLRRRASRALKRDFRCISDDKPPHMKILNMVILIVEEPGFKNVKNKHLGMSPF